MDDEGGKIGQEDESSAGEMSIGKEDAQCLPCIIMGPQWLEDSDMLSVEH